MIRQLRPPPCAQAQQSFRWFIVFASWISFLSCSHAPTPGPVAVAKPYCQDNPRSGPRYPSSEYLSYFGTSTVSQEEAEAKAKKGIAEQLNSQIVSVTRDFQSETQAGSKSERRGEYQTDVTVKASFSHAELIRIDSGMSGSCQGRFVAFAFLPIEETFENLRKEYEREAIPFRKAAEAATSAQDLPGFSASLRVAKERFPVMQGKAAELQALSQRQAPGFSADEKAYRDLLAARSEKVASVKLTVHVEADRKDTTQRLTDVLARALSAMGMTTISEKACKDGLKLLVKAKTSCQRGSFGPKCSVSMESDLLDCATSQVWAKPELSDPAFVGNSPQSEEKAVLKMWETITEKALAEKLKVGLAPVLPME